MGSSKLPQPVRYARSSGISEVSFLLDEMDVISQQSCSCSKFSSVIEEYQAIKRDLSCRSETSMEMEAAGSMAEDEKPRAESLLADALKEKLALAEQLEEEKHRREALQKENAALTIDRDLCLESQEKLLKEVEDWQFMLEQEKQRFENRITDLQKQNIALAEERDRALENQAFLKVEKLQEEIKQLNAMLDAADIAQKESSEQLFALSAKLAKLHPNGTSSFRAAIDMGSMVTSPRDQDATD